MKNKIYHLITFDQYNDKIIEILTFHNLENAIARGKELIKDWYKISTKCGWALNELYEYWEETHTFFGDYEIAESEFED